MEGDLTFLASFRSVFFLSFGLKLPLFDGDSRKLSGWIYDMDFFLSFIDESEEVRLEIAFSGITGEARNIVGRYLTCNSKAELYVQLRFMFGTNSDPMLTVDSIR